MKVKVISSFKNRGGIMLPGTVLEIPLEAFEKLEGKVEAVPADQKSKSAFIHQTLDRIKKVHAELDQAGPWPEYLLPYLQEFCPKAYRAAKNAERNLDMTVETQDGTGLDKALAEYKRVWLEGLTLWRERNNIEVTVGAVE